MSKKLQVSSLLACITHLGRLRMRLGYDYEKYCLDLTVYVPSPQSLSLLHSKFGASVSRYIISMLNREFCLRIFILFGHAVYVCVPYCVHKLEDTHCSTCTISSLRFSIMFTYLCVTFILVDYCPLSWLCVTFILVDYCPFSCLMLM